MKEVNHNHMDSRLQDNLNVYVHRDYINLGRDIKVGICDDIVNLVSSGGFPSSITIGDVLVGRSEVRNKVIARVFIYRAMG
ncbi:MAG TPA: hypothetical protein H9796_00825 [Candidatus Butyricimonas faecavium]|nr:hypothetical protein [Candidatus Butyricimonas faecavium]